MARQPTKTERVPLWLISDIVKREVRTNGDGLDWVFVQKSGSHFYNIRIRTKPVKRELRSSWARLRKREHLQGDAGDTGTNKSKGTHDGTGGEQG
jgi:hypothetical protein